MFDPEKLNIAFSYAWGNEEHTQWLNDFQGQLEREGFHVLRDQDLLKFGHNVPRFMNRLILGADVVLIILTPEYKEKSDQSGTGVYYEANRINQALYESLEEQQRFIPILLQGTPEESIPDFLKASWRADLTSKGERNDHLPLLLDQLKKLDKHCPTDRNPRYLEAPYEGELDLVEVILSNTKSALKKYFIENTSQEHEFQAAGIIKKIEAWEKEIQDYSEELAFALSDEEIEEFEEDINEFKQSVFSTELWTVSAALKGYDPELAAYRVNFAKADAQKLLDIVVGIKEAGQTYAEQHALENSSEAYETSKEVELNFLNDEEFLYKGVIGNSIRSEILHRLFPGAFPVMTRRSLWALHFLSDQEYEFTILQQRSRHGSMRLSHNWNYNYERFTFINHKIYKLFKDFVGDFGITLKPEIGYGYVNKVLVEYYNQYKKEVKELYAWNQHHE